MTRHHTDTCIAIQQHDATIRISGPGGTLVIPANDEIGRKLCMLIEGECGADGPGATARRYAYSTPRYFQLRTLFQRAGTAALLSAKRGPKRNYRRGGEVARQIIRYRFLDCEASTRVIGQKLRQDDWPISDRSVTRVITEFGLQKKGFINVGRSARRP